MRSTLRLLGWIGISFVPAAVGAPFTASEWYRRLSKPRWAPPAAVFGPVWTLLYVLMGIAAWRVSAEGEQGRGALRLFGLQLLLNGAWTPIFFGLRQPGVAFAEIVATWAAIVATLIAFARTRPVAGLLLVPYLAWVTFATALNWSIWRRNR